MADILQIVDVAQLRKEVQSKYREVAEKPQGDYHFHTGRPQAIRLGYDRAILDQLPEEACEAFAGVANPFHWEHPRPGERVVDLGSGAGTDSFFAALCVGGELSAANREIQSAVFKAHQQLDAHLVQR